jgi:5-oxoprolinase (ATP-hydrolysing) subunit C
VIEILSAGTLSTVQDLGRTGYLRYGVGTAGAMDRLALQAGNLLLGNAPDAAGIEVPVLPFKVRFLADMAFAVTGADAQADLDGVTLPPWWTQAAQAGQVLTLGRKGPAFGSGARSYLLVAGGIAVPAVLGSRSTQRRGEFGGHLGRALQRGDRLPAGDTGPAPRSAAPAPDDGRKHGFGVLPAAIALPQDAFCGSPVSQDASVTAVRVLPAAEYEDFDASSIEAFWDCRWKITAQSDRYGYRLAGTQLGLRDPIETRSHGIVPGVVQVPPGGQPIIQMRDAQPSGGYPKIGTVIEADLWRLAQARSGSHIRFVPTTYEEAVAALRPIDAYLSKVRQLARLYGDMLA